MLGRVTFRFLFWMISAQRTQFGGLSFCRKAVSAAFLCFAMCSFAGEPVRFSFRNPGVLKFDGRKFNLTDRTRDQEFLSGVRKLQAEGSRLSKKDRRGLNEIVSRVELLAYVTNEGERTRLQQEILEVAAAMGNNHRNPVPSYVGLPDLPFRFFDSLSNPVARGDSPASNLRAGWDSKDLSKIDPLPSTFWRSKQEVGSADLYVGFDRAKLPDFSEATWRYDGAKKGGGNPGCELRFGSRRIKVKFAETHSEPFASRIFHALGYHVQPTDYARELKVKYDRRFFLEFNSRAAIEMKIGVLFVPIHTFNFQRSYDPFEFIERAVFNDGTIRSGAELRELLVRGRKTRSDYRVADFRPEVEAQIDHLVTVAANVQVQEDEIRSIGPWDFAGLGHEDRREVRGAGVLAAWIGWWDARFDNTRLCVVDTETGRELRHYFNDLGAGLGLSRGTYRHSSEEPNEFAWTFTCRSRGGRIEFPGYEPIEDALAFKRITRDDARWMARLIGELSEEQITQALVASGFDSAEVRIYCEKLVSRRDQLIRDAGLVDEIPLLRSRGIDRAFNYSPRVAGPVQIRLRSGSNSEAAIGNRQVRDGRIENSPVQEQSFHVKAGGLQQSAGSVN